MSRKIEGLKRHMLHFTLREEVPEEKAVWDKLKDLTSRKELSDILRRAVLSSDEVMALVEFKPVFVTAHTVTVPKERDDIDTLLSSLDAASTEEVVYEDIAE